MKNKQSYFLYTIRYKWTRHADKYFVHEFVKERGCGKIIQNVKTS